MASVAELTKDGRFKGDNKATAVGFVDGVRERSGSLALTV